MKSDRVLEPLVALVVLIATLFSQTASAIDCLSNGLDKYKLQEVFMAITTSSQVHDTPPSKTNTTWYLNLCDQVTELAPECPKHAQICGIQEVSLPGQEPLKTQVIAFSNGLNYKVIDSNDTDVIIQLDESSWGSNSINANLNLHCSGETDQEKAISIEWNDVTGQFVLNWNTAGACLKTNKEVPVPPKDGEEKSPKDDDSWGWFTWLFIIMVLLFGTYIVTTSWISSSRTPADLGDAFHDFIDTLKSLPALAAEVFHKIVGSSDRGGYSAV